jgi:hypothetical protein
VPLMRVVPGLAGMRAPGRFYAITSFVVVWFAASGLDVVRRRLAAGRGERGEADSFAGHGGLAEGGGAGGPSGSDGLSGAVGKSGSDGQSGVDGPSGAVGHSLSGGQGGSGGPSGAGGDGRHDWLGGRGWRWAAGALLALALAFDLAPSAIATRPLRAEPDVPAVYAALRALPPREVGAILELPRLRPARESIYMYYSTLHWRPIANGYTGYLPDSYLELRAKIPQLPDDEGFALVRQEGITHLVIHAGGGAGRSMRALLPAWERQYLNRAVLRLFDDGADRIYKVVYPASDAAPRL